MDSGKTSNGKIWDEFADVYDKDMGVSSSVNNDLQMYFDLAKKFNDPILDIGCATGRVSIPLLKQGYKVVGIEPSAKLLEVFKNRYEGDNLTLYNCDALKWKNPEKIYFELIILPFDVFLQFLSRKKQECMLKKIIKWLSPTGLVVIDIFRQKNEDLVNYKGKMLLDYKKENCFRYKTIDTNFDTQVNEITYFYFEREGDEIKNTIIRKNYVRYITESEGILMLEKAGFRHIQCYGGFNKEKSCYDAKRIIYCASKEKK